MDMQNSFTRPEWIFKTNPERLSSMLVAIDRIYRQFLETRLEKIADLIKEAATL